MISGKAFRVALAACTVFLCCISYSSAGPKISALDGSLHIKTWKEFVDFVSDNTDKIVSVKIWVDAKKHDNKKGVLVADISQKQLVIYKTGMDGSGGDYDAEVVVNDNYRYEHGQYVIDGFFVIKSGGMHQGILSYGLNGVPDSQVLLSDPKISRKIIR